MVRCKCAVCWRYSSCIFSIPFLVSHLTNATVLVFYTEQQFGLHHQGQWKYNVGFLHPLTCLNKIRADPDPVFLVLTLLALCATSTLSRYFPRSALLNRVWFCFLKSVSIGPVAMSRNKANQEDILTIEVNSNQHSSGKSTESLDHLWLSYQCDHSLSLKLY